MFNANFISDCLLVVSVIILLFVLGYFSLDAYRVLAALSRKAKDKQESLLPVGGVDGYGEADATVSDLEEQLKDLELALFMNNQRLEEAEADRANLAKIQSHMDLLEQILVSAQNYIKILEEQRGVTAYSQSTEPVDFPTPVKESLIAIGKPTNLYEAGVYNGLVAILNTYGDTTDMVDPKAYPQPAKPSYRGKDGRFCTAPA